MSEATRCTPEEWGDHPGNPRRGLPRIMLYGARGHACGPRQSALASRCEGSASEPSMEQEVARPVEGVGIETWDEE